ncbi:MULTISPECIES: tRNA lysidine(34) synthetase TilS [unclassified Polaribacter]|uniref:tRNA lysidine(34) synthetase TilS n=1 Tax=unclassified Polaribacter TaxID=196858 RepID=UPI0011BD7BE9|nr:MULTISPECIES: tRNA lysidine(34) synthetase TilS [unclassified Polaribacter]TXD53437.1 tRNA lysidine(34) synthetase TilS [Polaribacter sp. IC063]TXD61461.1 tRNA lysidine(34) synthetase TilS [Polaribacter sp. IC066]
MIQKFSEHINANFPFLKDKKLLIAISGGLDSVVLTHLFSALNYTISLAHCNFKLRGIESNLDEEFVKKLSQKTSNQIFIKNFETKKYATENKSSTQIAARELRYTWFQEIIKEHNFNFVLTAHHADDNLETFLINLTRGSGLDGFTGIPEINGNIIRPILPFSRAEIMEYAKENKIAWREDASNATTKYIRNKIRHQIVPVLKEINPSLLSSFEKTIDNLKESQQIIEDRIEDVITDIIKKGSSDDLQITKIHIEKLQQLSNPKAYLYQFLKDYNFTEWNDVYHLLSAQSGKQVFSKTHRLLKDREFLLLSIKTDLKNKQLEEYFIQENENFITSPIEINFEAVRQKSTENKRSIYVDKGLLKYPLLVRKRQNGDYLYPLGMQGKKKLSKYFKDEKFSLLEKENTWLLCTANNEIIWVLNHRQDSRFSSKEHSDNILKITCIS